MNTYLRFTFNHEINKNYILIRLNETKYPFYKT